MKQDFRMFMAMLALSLMTAPLCASERPVDRHGALRVADGRIVDAAGAPLSLAGVSFFWSTTGWEQERFYNKGAVDWFAKDWRAGIVRAAVGVEPNGAYLTDPDGNRERAERVIEAAIDAGIYVIIDWHAHRAEAAPKEAAAFFSSMAKKYGDQPNVIYEIYNEPLNTADWSTVIKPYAEHVIGAIRSVDPDNLIIVGTQTWSQDVDKAALDPIAGAANIAYTLHFYAGTHKEELRAKAETAIAAGLPIMITEWGTVSATGDGGIDEEETRAWMKFVRRHQLTHLNWSVADKKESSALLKPGVPSEGGWSDQDLTESGRLVREIVRNWDISE